MNQKNKIIICLLFILASTNFVAQLDKNSSAADKGKIKAVILKNAKILEKPTSIGLDGNKGFKSAYNQEQEKLKEKQEEDDLNNKGIISQKKNE